MSYPPLVGILPQWQLHCSWLDFVVKGQGHNETTCGKNNHLGGILSPISRTHGCIFVKLTAATHYHVYMTLMTFSSSWVQRSIVIWWLSQSRFFSKMEGNWYHNFLEWVWLDCDAALTAWYWSDFQAQIRHGKRDTAVKYKLQYSPWLLCNGCVPGQPHPLPAVTNLTLYCTAAVATSPSLPPINSHCKWQYIYYD